jgi:hypothetical protein
VVSEYVTLLGVPQGLAASSWHPNDEPIRFQFETKPNDQPFDGQNLKETAILRRDPANLDSVAVTGQVPLDPSSVGSTTLLKWRVRAVDPHGRASDWAIGRPYGFIAVSGPVDFGEWDPGLLDPRGPIDIPRLFIGPNAPGGGPIFDLSSLDHWRGR